LCFVLCALKTLDRWITQPEFKEQSTKYKALSTKQYQAQNHKTNQNP